MREHSDQDDHEKRESPVFHVRRIFTRGSERRKIRELDDDQARRRPMVVLSMALETASAVSFDDLDGQRHEFSGVYADIAEELAHPYTRSAINRRMRTVTAVSPDRAAHRHARREMADALSCRARGVAGY